MGQIVGWMLTGWLAMASPALAETADEVVAKARAANQVESSVQKVTMTIVSRKGSERVKELELRSRRGEGKVSTLLIVQSPSSDAGTKMLMIDHDEGQDEQMFYLPAFRQVNRISGSSRKQSFVGSDFSFEDLDIREAAEGRHTLVETRDDAWVIETVPADSPQYGKIRSTIHKGDLVARSIEFFDKDGELIKRLEVLDTAEQDGHTLATRTRMTNLERGTHTVLEVTSQQIGLSRADLPDETFTAAYLER